jgi:hypothetical protein
VVLGPIAKGTPVGLLANLRLPAETHDVGDRASHVKAMGELAIKLNSRAQERPAERQRRRAAPTVREPEGAPAASEHVPGLVVNRGRYFGTPEFYMIAGLWTSGASVRVHSSAQSKMNISKGR